MMMTTDQERDAMRAVEDGLAGRNVPIVHEEIRHVLAMAKRAETERDAALADAARLRAVLGQVRDAMRATGQEPDGDDDPRRPLATAVWAALASTPAPAEPSARDMRVAEAWEAMQPHLASDDAGPEVWPALLAEVAMSPELRALCEARDLMDRVSYGTALKPTTWREWAAAAWVAYWDCDDSGENLVHSDLQDAVEYYVDGYLSPGCDVAAVVRENFPDGLTVYGWERKEVTPTWLHHTADELAERFSQEFDEEFGGGDDRAIDEKLEAEIAASIGKVLDAVRERLTPWQCEQVAEATLTADEVLEVLRGADWEATP